MLRKPIDRAVSHYFFIRQPNINPHQKAFNAAQKKAHNQVPLAEIFRANRSQKFRLTSTWLVDNMQTRYIAGYALYWAPRDSSILLKAAKRNLRKRYKVFGIQDRFQESLERIGQVFGLRIGPESPRLKTTRVEKIVSEEDERVLQRNHQLDLELYDYACELFRAG